LNLQPSPRDSVFRARTSLLLALLRRLHPDLLRHLDQPGVLHLAHVSGGCSCWIAGGLSVIEESQTEARRASSGWITGAQIFFLGLGIAAAALLAWGLWESRHLPFVADIGTLMAASAAWAITPSPMSHFFDLTGPSFAALRLPAILAALAFLLGPLNAWRLRRHGHAFESTVSVALTTAVILIACSHRARALRAYALLAAPWPTPSTTSPRNPRTPMLSFMLYGDQADGSSIIFYTHRPPCWSMERRSTSLPTPETNGQVFGSP